VSRSQWPRCLRRRSATARLLGLRVRIPPVAWMSVVSVVCWQVEFSATGWSLVLPAMVRRCVWSINLNNEEVLAHWGLSRQKQTDRQTPSDVKGTLATAASNYNGGCYPKLWTLNNHNNLLHFPLSQCCNNFWAQVSHFSHLNHLFCRPLDSAAWGGRTVGSPPPPQSTPLQTLYVMTDVLFSFLMTSVRQRLGTITVLQFIHSNGNCIGMSCI
jgi:hypothetical protein